MGKGMMASRRKDNFDYVLVHHILRRPFQETASPRSLQQCDQIIWCLWCQPARVCVHSQQKFLSRHHPYTKRRYHGTEGRKEGLFLLCLLPLVPFCLEALDDAKKKENSICEIAFFLFPPFPLAFLSFPSCLPKLKLPPLSCYAMRTAMRFQEKRRGMKERKRREKKNIKNKTWIRFFSSSCFPISGENRSSSARLSRVP